MRNSIYKIILLSVFFLCLIFPVQTLEGAVSGLMLWFDILLPTLLPFIIITTLIVRTQAFTLINLLLSPVLERIFHTSKSGSFAILVGFLCGYPMGAKVINDLYKGKSISYHEAQYLLSFCNNTSPMFIISFVMNQTLHYSNYTVPVISSVYLASIIMSFFTRKYYIKDSDCYSTYEPEKTRFSMNILDESIMDGISLITKIGGYIMMFSILICMTIHLSIAYLPVLQYFLPLLEITNGVQLYSTNMSFQSQIFPIIFLIAFGGICSIAQTQCVLEGSDLKIAPYIAQKIITAMIAVIIGMLFIQF